MNKTVIKNLVKMDLTILFTDKPFIVLTISFMAFGFIVPFLPTLLLPMMGLFFSLEDIKNQQYGVGFNRLFSLPIKKSEIAISKTLLQLILILISLPCYIFFSLLSMEFSLFVFVVSMSFAMIVCSITTALSFIFNPRYVMIAEIFGINILNLLTRSKLGFDIAPHSTGVAIFLLICGLSLIPLSIFISIKALEKKQLI